ncbi:hypothetical protein EYF80_025363 [Liparis tanakae]|uniref:Uncharacterized protein n=1 Tax=Liparis tanakae TaxID=230148 RepID=A0A4Z2HHJ6_9TELE|nr:hypothetical protein EYF80_025363 [Liparis tanakae]
MLRDDTNDVTAQNQSRLNFSDNVSMSLSELELELLLSLLLLFRSLPLVPSALGLAGLLLSLDLESCCSCFSSSSGWQNPCPCLSCRRIDLGCGLSDYSCSGSACLSAWSCFVSEVRRSLLGALAESSLPSFMSPLLKRNSFSDSSDSEEDSEELSESLELLLELEEARSFIFSSFFTANIFFNR